MDSLSLELQSREVVNQLLVYAGIVLFSLVVSLLLALGAYTVAAALLVGASFTILFFAQPKIAVLLLLAARFNLRVESIFGVSPDGILNLVTVLLGGFYWVMNHERIRWPQELRIMLVFLGFVVMSWFWSIWRIATLRMGLRIVGYYVLWMLVTGEFRTRRDLRLLINVLCLAAIPNVVYAIYGFLRNPAIFMGTTQKLGGLSYAYPWAVGQFSMALATLLLWYLAVSPRLFSLGNLLRWALFLACFLILVMSKTRAAIIAFMLSNLPLLFLTKFVSLERRVFAAAAVVLVVALTLPALATRFSDLTEKKTDVPWGEFDPDNSFEWRTELWRAELRYVRPYLLLGTGYGSIVWFNAFINQEVAYPVSGHGEYMKILIELGIPGVVLLACCMFASARYCWRRFKRGTDRLERVLAIAPLAVTLQWAMIAFVDDFLEVVGSATQLFLMLAMVRAYELYIQPELESEGQREPARAPAPPRTFWRPRFGPARA